MYQGNENLRGEGQTVEYEPWMVDEIIKCQNDIIYFCVTYFNIITIDSGKQLFNLREYQKKMLKCYLKPPKNKRHIICCLPRQAGKTSLTAAFLLYQALFNKDFTIACLANKQDTSKEILSRIKIAYESLPLWLQQGIVEWNKQSVVLENGSRIFVSTTTSSSISGKTLNLLYIDEMSKIPAHIATDFFTSTYPVISSGKTSKIIITSTPLGMNLFWKFWKSAINDENNFYPIKVHYWEIPGYTSEEWKKNTIADIGKVGFQQEYGLKFLGSSNTLVDADVLERIQPIEAIDFKWSGVFKIWENPIKGKEYVLGVDSAKGVGRDSSVIQVLKIEAEEKVEQVAIYKDNMIETSKFAEVCVSVAKFYNNAMMSIENNGEGSEVANFIWHTYEYDNLVNLEKVGLGIRSDRTSKLKGNLLLKRYVENKWLKIVDKDTVYELARYVEVSPNVFKSETQTAHDDCVTSLIWALYYLTTPYYEGRNTEVKQIEEKYKLENDTDAPGYVIDDGREETQKQWVGIDDRDSFGLGIF